MKKSFAVYMIMLFAILACIAESPKEKQMTTEEKEVFSAYEAINKAMIEKDRAAMERYFDKNLTFTHMSGKKQTREEFIGEIMDGTLNYFKVDTKDYSIRVDSDTAQMKVIHTLTAKVYGISGSWTMNGDNTYKKRGGIWVRVKRKIPLTNTNICLQCNIQPDNSCFLFSQFFAILTKLNANDTCVEAPLRQAVGTTSVLAAVRTIGGIYMFGRVMPVWSVVLVEFCFAYFMECVYGSLLSFRLACKNFDPKTTHPVLFGTAIICATVGLTCAA